MEPNKERKPAGMLTISQLAALRNININSLRYYERLGILCPAYVDPQTHYRYYALEQLHMLDIILLCVDLNIPLKRLSQFTLQDSVKLKEILDEGRAIAEKRYHDTVIGLKKIEYLCDFLQQEGPHAPPESAYTRRIPSRLLYLREYRGDLRDVARIQRAAAQMIAHCPPDCHPTFMSGLLLEFGPAEVRQFLFYELLEDETLREGPHILRVPEGDFQCFQLAMEGRTCDYYQLIEEEFGAISQGRVLISNLVKDSMQFETSYRELQRPLF